MKLSNTHKHLACGVIFADLAGILIGSWVYVIIALLFKLFRVPGWQ